MDKTTKQQKNMNYSGCKDKRKAREETIMNVYKHFYGRDKINEDEQYWTMCGICGADGVLKKGSEPEQLIIEGFVKPNQIHGVELRDEIFNENNKIKNGINWHLGDFHRQMVIYADSHKFKPAIVNADLIYMADKAAEYISKILEFLSCIDKSEIMLLCNFVSRNVYYDRPIEYMIEELEQNRLYQSAINKVNWQLYSKYYNYNGTKKGKSKRETTVMNTLIFIKNP